MGTVSTIDLVKRTLVDKFTTALATSGLDGGQVPVFYAWPGRNTPAECVYMGLFDEHRVEIVEAEIPTMKAGRKYYDEIYRIPFTIWSMRPDLSPTQAETCEQRAFEILDPVRDVFADDPQLGLGTTIMWAKLTEWVPSLLRLEAGWASEIAPVVEVKARLT